MKKGVVFAFVFIILVATSVFAQTEIAEDISENVTDYIQDFVGNVGVEESEIDQITEVDQGDLPDDLEIQDIDENKVGIFEVNFTEDTGDNRTLFVVTYATEEFEKKEEKLTSNIQILSFGTSSEKTASSYLETANGVTSGEAVGYVMLRGGSITGISTSLQIVEGSGNLYIKVYKNGQDTGFENLITSSDSKKIDFDLQSENILSYKPGDVISVFVEQEGNLKWTNVVTSVETTS